MNGSPETTQNFVVQMPDSIDEFVRATPLLADLHFHFPEAKITAMCQRPLDELLLHDPAVREIFSFEKPSPFLRRDQKRDLTRKLQQGKYDWGILTTRSLSPAWWFWQGKVKNRIGFCGSGRSFFLTHPLPTEKQLLSPLGIPPSQTAPHLFVSQREKDEASALLKRLGAQKKIIGICPSCCSKELQEATESLARRTDLTTLYFGKSSMKEPIGAICKGLPKNVLNLAGHTSLRELMALLEKCSLLLTNEKGAKEIALALQTAVIPLGTTNNGSELLKIIESNLGESPS